MRALNLSRSLKLLFVVTQHAATDQHACSSPCDLDILFQSRCRPPSSPSLTLITAAFLIHPGKEVKMQAAPRKAAASFNQIRDQRKASAFTARHSAVFEVHCVQTQFRMKERLASFTLKISPCKPAPCIHSI